MGGVLIVDDHPVFRFGIRTLLETDATLEVIGEATNGQDAIRQVKELKPEVVLMDLNLPGLNGIEAIKQISALNSKAHILVVTMFNEDDSVIAAMRAGARGYLLKGVEGGEMLQAIKAVSRGEAIFSPAIAQRLMQYFGAPRSSNSAQPFPDLTGREREVLGLLAEGYTNQKIGEKLIISPKTVRNHISVIYSKLQVSSRLEAIVLAKEAGLT